MLLYAIKLLLLVIGSTDAFSSLPSLMKHKAISYINLSSKGSGDDVVDIDAKIRSLNKMFGIEEKASDVLISTSKRRRNLEREIELLSQLDPEYLLEKSNPDGAENYIISEFWSIWYGECGDSNERVLRAFEEELVGGGPNTWPEAEKEYVALIEKHCGGSVDGKNLDLSLWVEPANRLATLLYMMGRLDESKMWCQKILDAKPWHIGALSGIILVCMQLNDQEGVLKWASKGLPRLSEDTVDARKEWVQRNVALAEKKLSELEELGETCMKVSSDAESSELDDKYDDEGNAWQ